MNTKERNQKPKKSASGKPENVEVAVRLSNKKNGSVEAANSKTKAHIAAAKPAEGNASSKQGKLSKSGKTTSEAKNSASSAGTRSTQKSKEQNATAVPKAARTARQNEPITSKSRKSTTRNETAEIKVQTAAKQTKPVPTSSKKSSKVTESSKQAPAEPYVTTLPEFKNDLELLSYFGIELFDPLVESTGEPVLESATAPTSDLLDFAPEKPARMEHSEASTGNLEADPLEELARLLATAEEAEALKTNFELIHKLREEDIALQEVEVIRLNDLAFGQINNAVAHLTDEAHALVEGKSQVFFHDRSSGKLFGQEVYAFVYDHATVESVDSRVIAAGRAVVYADGGWIGAKDESIVHAKGNSTVQAAGDAIVVAEGNSSVDASGTVAVLVNSASVRIRLLSDDACIILMDLQLAIPEIETPDRNPPKIHQLVSIDSPLGLEKMMELSFREAQRRERLSWDYS